MNWKPYLLGLPGYDPYRGADDYEFDRREVEQRVEFIERYCTYSQGPKAGQPFVLEKWQKGFVANLFGWKRRGSGLRRYRMALLFIGRGNGKSEFAAALINSIGFQDAEQNAQMLAVAAKQDQTKFVVNPVKAMIRNCPAMASRAKIFRSAVEYPIGGFKAISREATTEHGGTTYFADIDELHAQPDRELFDVLLTSSAKHEGSLLLMMTTSDYDREGSVCNEIHGHAQRVRDGIIDDPTFLPAIFEAQREDDWHDPMVWKKANPNLGVSIQLGELQRLHAMAIREPSFENAFKRLHLNVRTEQALRLIPMDAWDRCNGALQELDGRTCFGGLDLARSRDLASFVLVFPADDGTLDVVPRVFCPSSVLEKAAPGRIDYRLWERRGLLEISSNSEHIDSALIRQRIKEDAARYNLVAIGYDPYNAADLCENRLTNEDGIQCVKFPQGFLTMNEPLKRLLQLVADGKLRHGGHPVLRWMASNMSVRTDVAGNLRPDKSSDENKIDGIVALTMAVGMETRLGCQSSPELLIL